MYATRKLALTAALAIGVAAGSRIANAASGSGSSTAAPSIAATPSIAGQASPRRRAAVGGQRSDETPLTGDTKSKVEAAAKARLSGARSSARRDADGNAAYEVHMVQADGTPATVYVNEQFDVVSVQTGMPGGPAGRRSSSSGPRCRRRVVRGLTRSGPLRRPRTTSATASADRGGERGAPPRAGDHRLAGDRLAAAVRELERARNGRDLPPQSSYRSRELPLRIARRAAKAAARTASQRISRPRSSRSGAGGAPRERERDVVVEPASEELQVVDVHRNTPAPTKASSQRSNAIAPPIPIATAPATECGECGQDAVGDACSEWAAVQRRRVRADPDGEKECRERSEQPGGVPLGRERGADRDVAQVPERVRGEGGSRSRASRRGERVERGPRRGAHDRRPQMTIPPPRLSRR